MPYNSDRFSGKAELPPYMPDNPTDEERHALLWHSLKKGGRPEDIDDVIRALAPPPDVTTIAPPGRFKGMRVGIIGGGQAGLAAAFELRKLGFDITVFEALKRIGGRFYTYYFDEEERYYGELGTMRFPVSHETTWHYINLFGLKTRPFVQNNRNAILYIRGERARNDPAGKSIMERIYPKFHLSPKERNTPPSELQFYALESPILRMPEKVRPQLITTREDYSPEILYFDSQSARDIFEKGGLSQEAINLIGSLSPSVSAYLYHNYIEVLREAYAYDFVFLYEIVGGAVKLPRAFYRSLMSENPPEYGGIPGNLLGKVAWKSGAYVDGIFRMRPDGRVTVRYRDMDTGDHRQEDFDFVVCAIPFSTLRNARIDPPFSPRKMQAIRELTYAQAQKSLMFCRFRFWEKGGVDERIIGGGSFTDLPISQIWYPSDHARLEKAGDYSSWDFRYGTSPDEPGVLLASYNFIQDAVRLGNLPEFMAFEIIKRQVEQVHGLPYRYLDGIALGFARVHWDREPAHLGAFAYYMPEQKRLFSYAVTLPEYGGRVFFAGEHISATHSWANGAYRTARQAALDIARNACKI